MDQNQSSLVGGPAPSSPPRILIADYDPSMLESFGTLANEMLEMDFEFSTSRDHAMRKLLASSYHLVISGVYLAELDNFMFIKKNLTLRPSMPCVITAKASDKESARGALNQGALDVIVNPINVPQACSTIRLALWQNTLLELIAQRDQALEKLQQHLAQCPVGSETDSIFKRTLSAMEQSIVAYKRSMQRMHGDFAFLNNFSLDVQKQTRERAMARIDGST